MKTQVIVRAIVLLACGALALRQVSTITKCNIKERCQLWILCEWALSQVFLLIEEYSSLPTTTSYEIEEVNAFQPPAFTFCPKRSPKSQYAGDDFHDFEQYENKSITLKDFVISAPYGIQNLKVPRRINGEVITNLSTGEPCNCVIKNTIMSTCLLLCC